MEANILKTFAEIAGIGGICVGVLLLIFRDIIRKNIFPKFKDEKLAYRLLRMIVILVWSVAIIGIIAWVHTTVSERKVADTINIANNDFSGDMHFSNINFILSQQKNPLSDAQIKEIERGVNLVKAGYYEKAIPIFKKMSDQTHLPALYNNLGVLYAMTGEMDASREAYSKAAEQTPNDKNLHFNIGLLEEKEGRIDEAVKHFEKADADYAKKASMKIEEKIKAGVLEVEPNNDLFTPNIIELRKWVQGTLADGGDIDFFKIKTPEIYRDIIKIEIKNGTTTMKPRIEVYYENKQWLGGTTGNSYNVTSGQDTDYSYTTGPNLVYYVGIKNLAGESGDYKLRVYPLKAYDTYEPNDDLFNAKKIPFGNTVEANIMDNADLDFYSIKSLSKKTDINITLKNMSTSIKPRIEVYYENKQWLGGTTGNSYNVTSGQDTEYSFSSEPDLIYFICIKDLNGSSGKYRLTVKEKK
jgi:tetratricopeptide (TPR) repeat protein